MPFRVAELELQDFRNFEHFRLSTDPALTVLIGPNGAGKTSIIEALQVASAGTSFRKTRWADVVRRGGGPAIVTMRAEDGARARDLTVAVAASGQRTFTVNGSIRKSASDVVGTIPCVVFTPEDLGMVKGPSVARRAAIDETGDQLSPVYASLRTEYARVLRQRNAALKTDVESVELAVLDDQLVEIGGRLTAHRARLADKLSREAVRAYAALASGEGLEATFVPSWGRARGEAWYGDEEEAKGLLRQALGVARPEERSRQMTVMGPHRDDVGFKVAGYEARAFGSQGQQRAVALAWKLAQVEVIEEVSGNPPLLLLDDVMSELDEERRHALVGLVSGRTQAVMTTTNPQYFSEQLLERASVVEVGNAP